MEVQKINSSVLTDWLEVTKQMHKSLLPLSGEFLNSQNYQARRICENLNCLNPSLDALRALVAEQEREEVKS